MNATLAKQVFTLVVGFSASYVTSAILKSLIAGATLVQKILIALGIFGISGAVAAAAQKYASQFFDDMRTLLKSLVGSQSK